jgi:GntR family transcriptional regulator
LIVIRIPRIDMRYPRPAMELVRQNASPLQEQIAASLRREIADGAFEPSGRLPSEAELTARFGVSRVTVRLALARLEAEGAIERRQGKGSYASGKRIRHELDTLLSFHESLKAQGLAATLRTLSHAATRLPPELKGVFGPRVTRCVEVRRLHAVDGEPVALATSLLPAALEGVDWHAEPATPLYALLESRLGLKVLRAEITLRADALDAPSARVLGLKKGAPALVMRRASFAADGRCCDRTVFLIRPERYEFCLNSATSARIGALKDQA